jgi:phosphate transport system substrate-binding protein
VTNWKAVGGADAPIVLYSRENSSGTYVFFKDNVLKGEDFAASAQTLPGTAAVVNAVSKEKNGIGYGGAAYAKGVKEVKIVGKDGQAATDAERASGKYPLALPFIHPRQAVRRGQGLHRLASRPRATSPRWATSVKDAVTVITTATGSSPH